MKFKFGRLQIKHRLNPPRLKHKKQVRVRSGAVNGMSWGRGSVDSFWAGLRKRQQGALTTIRQAVPSSVLVPSSTARSPQ